MNAVLYLSKPLSFVAKTFATRSSAPWKSLIAASTSVGYFARASFSGRRFVRSQRTVTGRLSEPSVSGTSRRPSKNFGSFRSTASFQIETPPTRFGSQVAFGPSFMLLLLT